jgi:hypothetical protein
MTRLLSHVRHNVVAYVALFVALGGTSYAAVSLPRGSVGSPQLKNHSITPVKESPRYINGNVRAWAIVSPSGKVLAGGGGPSAQRTVLNNGTFIVRWRARLSSRCAAVGSIDSALSPATETVPIPGGTAAVTAGYVVVGGVGPISGSGGGLSLTTFSQAGQPIPLAFHVMVVC